ncbi:charged multivesicular body protein 3-like [Lineus longissimus]|uniref:charged multivesicular body protein 3-like n=1 Tax=Lineus longissimus TaxID=88925 RepID=UPI002B4DE830
MGLFGKTPQKDPKEQCRTWCSAVRKEGRGLDRQIRAIQNEEAKVVKQIKAAAKKGDNDVCRILAKEVVNSRKAVNKIYCTKAHLSSVEMQMKSQLATLRVAGSLSKSTEVMKSMQALIKVPEVMATMQAMSKEMMKAGILEEMIDDTFESLEDDDLEDDADAEVERILNEVVKGVIDTAPAAGAHSLAEPEGATADFASDEEEDVSDMQQRLAALKS